MNVRAELREEIKLAFGSIPFPAHRGLRAAMAMDEWQSNPERLAEITQEQDFHGEWWDIPSRELEECSLAIAYLDAAGVEFYLPAYMTLTLDNLPRARVWVLNFLDPRGADVDPALREYFRGRLARIIDAKKTVCVRFMEFLRSHWSAEDPLSRSDFISVSTILEHDFWRK